MELFKFVTKKRNVFYRWDSGMNEILVWHLIESSAFFKLAYDSITSGCSLNTCYDESHPNAEFFGIYNERDRYIWYLIQLIFDRDGKLHNNTTKLIYTGHIVAELIVDIRDEIRSGIHTAFDAENIDEIQNYVDNVVGKFPDIPLAEFK
jgi:hypothetical protein